MELPSRRDAGGGPQAKGALGPGSTQGVLSEYDRRNDMEMLCPECGMTEQIDALPMRLQTCSRCAKAGADAYLTTTAPRLEMRQPAPRRLAGRAAEEGRRFRPPARPAAG